MFTVLHDSARTHAPLPGQEAMLVTGVPEAGEPVNQEAMWSFANSTGGGSRGD